MGLIHANIQLLNPEDVRDSRRGLIADEQVRRLELRMLVDTGSVMLAINEEICNYLGLDIFDQKPSVLADGTRLVLPVAGPVEVRFEDRVCRIDALVLPGDSDPLLGSVPMEEMDLVPHPARHTLSPLHPEGPVMVLK